MGCSRHVATRARRVGWTTYKGMVDAVVQNENGAREVRSITAQLPEPVLVGNHKVFTRFIRSGSAMSMRPVATVSVSSIQGGFMSELRRLWTPDVRLAVENLESIMVIK